MRASWLRGVALAATLALAAGACGGARAPFAIARGSETELDAAIDALRFRLASHPRDHEARSELATLELARGRPGAALGHFERLRSAGALDEGAGRALGRLLATRGALRLRRGDGGAVGDLDDAAALGARISVETRRAGEWAALLAGLRHSDPVTRDAAIARFRGRAVADPGLADDPRAIAASAWDREALLAATRAQLAAAGTWAWDGGARRSALRLLDAWVAHGGIRGEPPARIARWLAARQWWSGADGRPDLGYLDDATAAGVDLCAIAHGPGELGCGTLLLERALHDQIAPALLARAERFGWRTAGPAPAAAFAIIAIDDWISGRSDDGARGDAPAGWVAELARRVEVAALGPTAAAAPAFARPALLIAAGLPAAARERLDALRTADRAAWTPIEQVVAAAAALALDAEATAVELLAGAGADPRALALAARGVADGGDSDGLRALLAAAPSAARARAARAAGLLAAATESGDRTAAPALTAWRALAGSAGMAAVAANHTAVRADVLAGAAAVDDARDDDGPAPDAAAATGARNAALAGAAEALLSIATAWERDPALADRLAADYIDGVVDVGVRGPRVAALFAALGDPPRAAAIAGRVAAVSDRDPGAGLALAIAAAHSGDGARALQLLTESAAASGDPGALLLAGARALFGAGLGVEALGAGRDALALTAPDEAQDVLRTLAEIMGSLGRTADADAMRAAWRTARLETAPSAPDGLGTSAPPSRAAALSASAVLAALARGLGGEGAAARAALEAAASQLVADQPVAAAVTRALATMY